MITKKSNFQNFQNVLFAFFMRELKTRFGTSKNGYLWMLAEPIFHILLLSTIFYELGKTISINISFPMFLIIGLLPYFLFNNIVNKIIVSIEANKGLMAYSPVEYIDPIIARTLLEVFLFMITFLIVNFIFVMIGIFEPPQNTLLFFSLIFGIIIFAFGFGLISVIIKEYWTNFNKILVIFMRPLYYISGIFFTANIIPSQYRDYFLYNPLFQYIEALRASWFRDFNDQYVNYYYIFGTSIVFLAISLLVYQLNKERIKITS